MRFRNVLFLVAAFLVASASLPAAAKNMHGKFGFGFQRTLLGVQGFDFTYWATPKLSAGLIAGLGFDLDPDNDSTTMLLGSVGFKYVLVGTRHANLSVGLLADLGWANRILYDSTDQDGKTTSRQVKSPTQWGIELPIEVEYFFSDAFSINLASGFTFTMVPDLPADAAPGAEAAILHPEGLGAVSLAGSKGIALGAGSLFGHAGFSFYF